jgi:hypothetical protein
MERTQGFAPSDFSDNVEADITDIRAVVVRALRVSEEVSSSYSKTHGDSWPCTQTCPRFRRGL